MSKSRKNIKNLREIKAHHKAEVGSRRACGKRRSTLLLWPPYTCVNICLLSTRKRKNTRQHTGRRIIGGCVCAECWQSRLAAPQLAAESPLLSWLPACTTGWLSFLATTKETTTTTDGKIHNQNSLTYLWRTTGIG